VEVEGIIGIEEMLKGGAGGKKGKEKQGNPEHRFAPGKSRNPGLAFFP